ncbi:MAG: zinc ribbon domain-containing protein [Flavobacteriales bacterium]
MAKATSAGSKEATVESKLAALYNLQQIDSKIDKIKIIRGELPLEVRDLEDELIGLETRVVNLTEEGKAMDKEIAAKKNTIKDAEALIKKYEAQQAKVRNNREYDSLSKEIEFQNLEIQLSQKRIKEFGATIDSKKEVIAEAKKVLDMRKDDLKRKQKELDEIVNETQKEEQDLMKASKKAEALIEERLLIAYKRIRSNSRNGLVVVSVERDACGGCFNKIPPQRQMDIRMRKKIIVCEHCGRILIDQELAGIEEKAPVKEVEQD